MSLGNTSIDRDAHKEIQYKYTHISLLAKTYRIG